MKPDCAVCGGPAAISNADWEAELAYAKEHGGKPRDFYCSMDCFRIRRDEVTRPKGGRGGHRRKPTPPVTEPVSDEKAVAL